MRIEDIEEENLLVHDKVNKLVIVKREGDSQEFVCWYVDREGNFFWGAYHTSFGEAFDTYVSRSNRLLKGETDENDT